MLCSKLNLIKLSLIQNNKKYLTVQITPPSINPGSVPRIFFTITNFDGQVGLVTNINTRGLSTLFQQADIMKDKHL